MMTYDKWRVEMWKYALFVPKLCVGSVITLRDDPKRYIGVADNMHLDCATIRYKVLSIHNNGDLIVKQLRRRKRNLFLITQYTRRVLWPFDVVSISMKNFSKEKQLEIQQLNDEKLKIHRNVYKEAGFKQLLPRVKKKIR